jgi:hypothetical protein
MAYQPTILVDLDFSSGDYGNIVSSINNSSISNSENVYYKVTSPLGVIIKDFDFGTPDAVLTIPVPNASLPLVLLPQVANGGFEEGVYQWELKIEDVGVPEVYVDVALSFDLDVLSQGDDGCEIKGLINFEVDCFCLKMKATDSTDYKGYAVTRELTIIPPTIPSEAAPVNLQTAAESITFDFEYSGVTYTANLFSVIEHTTPAISVPADQYEDVQIRESITVTATQEVFCGYNFCKLMECIEEFFVSCVKEASRLGGISYLPIDKLEAWMLIENYLTRYSAAISCNNTTAIAFYYDKLKALTGCACCNTEGSNQIVKLTAVCSSGSFTAIQGTAPVKVTTVAGTATVSLDQSFLDLVYNGISSLVLDGSNNTADYLSVLAGATATERKLRFDDTPLKYGAWDIAEDADMVAAFGVVVSTTPEPIRWSINTFLSTLRVEGTFRVNINNGIPICLYNVPSIAASVSTRDGAPIPCFNSVGECVGKLHLSGIGANKNLLFTSNSHFVVGDVIFTNGVFNIEG